MTTTTNDANPLGYASRATIERRAPEPLRLIALICGMGTGAIGLFCLLGFAATSEQVFVFAGFYTLLASPVPFLIGIVAAIVYSSLARGATVDREGALRRGAFVTWVLLLDIPLAILCAVLGIYLVGHR